MRLPAKKTPVIVLAIAVILISSQLPAQEQSPGGKTSAAKEVSPVPAPDLAEIIPSATRLSSRLAALENKVTVVLDISEIEIAFPQRDLHLRSVDESVIFQPPVNTS